MNKINGIGVALAVMLAVGMSAIAFAEEAQKMPAEKPLKVLMIGNSFSQQMPKAMPPVVKDLGLKLDICSLYIGGCPISKHWHNVQVPTSMPYRILPDSISFMLMPPNP